MSHKNRNPVNPGEPKRIATVLSNPGSRPPSALRWASGGPNCRTPTTETETYRTGKTAEFLASLEALSVFGRLGQPREIAGVVAFLASDAAGWVTAQNIRVNGGTA